MHLQYVGGAQSQRDAAIWSGPLPVPHAQKESLVILHDKSGQVECSVTVCSALNFLDTVYPGIFARKK